MNQTDQNFDQLTAETILMFTPAQAYRAAVSAATTETDFDARIELRIAAAQLNLRVHVEILCNRAERDIAIETHHALRDLFKSIKYGVHHAEI